MQTTTFYTIKTAHFSFEVVTLEKGVIICFNILWT